MRDLKAPAVVVLEAQEGVGVRIVRDVHRIRVEGDGAARAHGEVAEQRELGDAPRPREVTAGLLAALARRQQLVSDLPAARQR